MQKASLSPSLGEQEQAQAFAALAAARHALRTHLHGCKEVASHILTRARDAVSGVNKNEAKKFFQKEGPTEQKLRACSQPANQKALSTALHALEGKQALYSECCKVARSATSQKKATVSQAEVDSRAAYLRQLKSLESDYIKKRSHLVEGNLRLVAAVIKRLHIHSMPWEDLLQYGAISLQKAVESFNPVRKVKFSTYAVPVVRGDLIRFLENFSNEVRIPSHVWEKMRQYNKVEDELCFVLGRAPSHVEMALEMGITVKEAVQLQQYHWSPVSLNAPQGSMEDGMSLLDTLADQNTQLPGSGSSAWDEFIAPHADGLGFVERRVLRSLAGDGVSPRMDEEEIALALGLDKAAVSDAIASGFQKVLEARKAAAEAA
jgi:RNA polymerase primary sigma factor